MICTRIAHFEIHKSVAHALFKCATTVVFSYSAFIGYTEFRLQLPIQEALEFDLKSEYVMGKLDRAKTFQMGPHEAPKPANDMEFNPEQLGQHVRITNSLLALFGLAEPSKVCGPSARTAWPCVCAILCNSFAATTMFIQCKGEFS